MKKKETTPDVWITHRKLRKKIASARWYAKKKKMELHVQRQRRIALEQQWKNQMQQAIWSSEQFAEWRCVCAHMFHGWPACPITIGAVDWCRLMDLAEMSIQRMGENTTKNWSKRKMKLCRHLVLKELCEWYRDHACDVDSVHSRMKDRNWSNSHRVNSSSSSSSSSSSVSSASRLCGGWFPFLCTDVGMVFLQLAVLGQVHRWPDVCRLMYQVAVAANDSNRIHDVHTMMGDKQRHTKTPIHNPMHNPCLNDPILEQLIELMFEMEQDMEETQQQSGEPTTFSSNSSTSSSLLDSLDSFLLRDLFRPEQIQNEYNNESDQSSGSDCSYLEP